MHSPRLLYEEDSSHRKSLLVCAALHLDNHPDRCYPSLLPSMCIRLLVLKMGMHTMSLLLLWSRPDLGTWRGIPWMEPEDRQHGSQAPSYSAIRESGSTSGTLGLPICPGRNARTKCCRYAMELIWTQGAPDVLPHLQSTPNHFTGQTSNTSCLPVLAARHQTHRISHCRETLYTTLLRIPQPTWHQTREGRAGNGAQQHRSR